MRIVLDLQGAQSESRFRGIGRYSLALAQAMVRGGVQHEFLLVLSGRFPDSIDRLCRAFADLIPPDRIRVMELPGPVSEADPGNAWRMQAAELVREKFLADLRPDVVHVSSMLTEFGSEAVVSAGRFSSTIPTAATLYDLIPLLRPETQLSSAAAIKRSYFRHIQSLKRTDLLLAISESSRQETIEKLDISPERIVTVGAGLSDWFANGEILRAECPDFTERYNLRRPFIMCTGGDDSRKNMEGLISAFALLPSKLQKEYQLEIVCNLSADARDRLTATARRNGLQSDQLILTGYISDQDLRRLYAACSVFVFPCLHEGSGLPILEAIASGAPVIGSNCSSIPEIINRPDALFDPRQPKDIARCMANILSDPALRQNLKEWSRQRAKTFTWETCAQKALRAFEALYSPQKTQITKLHANVHRRPRLAFVSPLPPVQSGIAGYAARLLPNLARYYEIVCIVDQPEVTDPWISAEFPIRDVRWFEANAERFERIVYQFGNSLFHKHMFALLAEHPGIVVLHDFCLSAPQDWMEHAGYGSFAKALYDSHGFWALKQDRENGRRASIVTFPCNAPVLQASIAAIVHSEHAIALARNWYGNEASFLMRRVPFLPFPPEPADRLEARKRLDLPEDAFIICTFGWLAPHKLNDRLLEAWLTSSLAEDEKCFLMFVGETGDADYRRRLLDRIAQTEFGYRIRLNGYVNESHYRDYVSAADLAVQLRASSRGETSAAIFDCLSRQVPLVINAHGSAAELPDDVTIKLEDNLTADALSAALGDLRSNPDLRRNLAARGSLYLSELHHPERIAEMYREVIEDSYSTSPRAREKELLLAISRITASTEPTEGDLLGLSAALAANRERFGPRQILVDVTLLAKLDVRTGIQRVTRGILLALISDPPSGYRIEPVRAVSEGYVYARQFACQFLGIPNDKLPDDPVETGFGDIFIGLDLSPSDVPRTKDWFVTWHQRGVRILFVIYDLLPLTCPEFFSPTREIDQAMLAWVNTVAEVADGVACSSRTVADQFYEWLLKAGIERQRPLAIGFFHLGADLHASSPTTGIPEDAQIIPEWLSSEEPAQNSDTIPWLTWHESSRQLLDVLLGKGWYRSWTGCSERPM